MSIFVLITIFIILFIIELAYFRVANYFNITDRPNHRSSHSKITLRGGGVIFSLSLLLCQLYFEFRCGYFLLGLAIISLISFFDDIKPVSNRLRLLFHLVGVALMFYQLDFFHLPIYWIILSLIFVVGSINAVNFMDGINGITGAYSLITLCTLLYINVYITTFISTPLLITSVISVLVFNFFNFRKRAKCFAGDVGSVSIAFIILFFLLKLISTTGNLAYLLLLILYGLDVVTTILFRLIRKENILEAHRSHFYQFLANEKNVPHLKIAFIYAIVQLLINTIVVLLLPKSIPILLLFSLVSTLIFITIRFLKEGSVKLLKH